MRKQRTEDGIMVTLAGLLFWVMVSASIGCDGDGPFSTQQVSATQEPQQQCPGGSNPDCVVVR